MVCSPKKEKKRFNECVVNGQVLLEYLQHWDCGFLFEIGVTPAPTKSKAATAISISSSLSSSSIIPPHVAVCRPMASTYTLTYHIRTPMPQTQEHTHSL